LKYKHELPRFLFIAAFAGLTAIGCAQSEPMDVSGEGGSGEGGNAAPAGAAGQQTTSGAGGSVTNSGEGGSGTGTAGSPGEGGTTGTAGTTGAAGTTGKGGTTGTAGSTGAAGTTGKGGSTGAAGTTGKGGSTGAAGTTGKGGSTGTPDAGTPDAGSADGGSAPTFTQIYTTILTQYCGGSSCHNPGKQGSVSFATQSSAYSAVKSRVTPGNGANSSFYTLVNTGRMPQGGAKLSAANLAMIKAWIDAGALNN
jgi:hypothetical protein